MRIDVNKPEGNVLNIMALVHQLLVAQRRPERAIALVIADMRSGDYRHALEVANRETFGSFEFVGLDEHQS